MKKLIITNLVVLFMVCYITAQRTIRGTVTTDKAVPLIGASITEKGVPLNGVISDFEGKYAIEVAEGTTLTISYIGYDTKEIAINENNTINVQLIEGIQLSEVMVTALGISREKKSVGYAAQEVKGEDLSLSRETNVVSSLAGRVSGVQVTSASGASLGGSANIRIRGSNGLTGGRPLFVVDGTPISNTNFSGYYLGTDYGNLAQDINPDDIKSITVLKGPSATALYGSRAANGVVMITSKTGAKREGIGVTVNSSVTFDEVYLLPEYQNEYAGGYDGQFQQYADPQDGQTYNGLEYYADESWGPKIDGTTLYRPWWSWFPGEDYGEQVPITAHPDNVKDFFETGVAYNNNLVLSGGTDQTAFRLSYTNVRQTGVIPNSQLEKNNLSVNASLGLTDKLKVSTSINFATNKGEGRPEFGYATDNPVNSFNQWFQRQLDMERLRKYRNPDGSFRSWNLRSHTNLRPLYWDSPFFSVYENYSTDGRDRYFGNITATYQILQNLSVEAAIRRDKYTQRIENRVASGGLQEDFYSEFVAEGQEDNYDFLFKYDNSFSNFTVDANLGGAIRKNDYHSNYGGTSGGLNAPNLFNLKASVDRPGLNSYISEKLVRSVYGALNFGFKNFIYLGGTLRNDWSSALPEENNSYLYPSVNASFVFSELLGMKFLTFGKLRASYAEVGSDISPYRTNFTYSSGRPYGSTPSFTLPNTLINENLKPALSSSIEFGLEMSFLQKRFGVDITYYKEDNEDQILTLEVPGSSGFSSAIINAGNIRDEGVELSLFANPVRTKNFAWDLTFNIAKNESKVIELAENIDNRRLAGWGWGSFTINAPVGGQWGMMRGTAFKRINGVKVMDEDGTYLQERDQDLGTFLPDYTGGVINSFQLFGVKFSALVDFQIGGQFHSITKMFNAYSGLSIETAGSNDKGKEIRDPVSEGGGMKVEGVLEDGSPYSTYVHPQTHFSSLFALHENWIYDASYVKLRELRVGYNFPKKWITKWPVTSLNLSLIARNVWLIYSEVTGLDPSEISPGSNQYVFTEGGILPGVRSMGVNLKVEF